LEFSHKLLENCCFMASIVPEVPHRGFHKKALSASPVATLVDSENRVWKTWRILN
jgi:hypothetical protein